MATDLERLVVQLSADIKKYENAMNRATGVANRQMRRIEQTTSASVKRINDALSNVGKEAFSNLTAPLTGIGAALGTRELIQYADAWTQAGNLIRASATAAGVGARSLNELKEGANEARTSLETYTELYARLIRSASGVAKSEEEIALATNLVAKAMKAGGASAQEQQASLIQLGQALGSGVLQGDELRSLRENAPVIAKAIADEFKVSIAGLKKLGEEGKLTSERVFKAILNAQKPIEAQFKATNATIADAFTQLNNEFTAYIGNADKSAGASAQLVKALQFVADNFKEVADVVAAFATVLITAFTGRAIAGVVVGLGNAVVALGAFLTALRTGTGVAMAFSASLGPIGLLAGAAAGAVYLLYNSMSSGDRAASSFGSAIDANKTALEGAASASRQYQTELVKQISLQLEAAKAAYAQASADADAADERAKSFYRMTGLKFDPLEYAAESAGNNAIALAGAVDQLEVQQKRAEKILSSTPTGFGNGTGTTPEDKKKGRTKKTPAERFDDSLQRVTDRTSALVAETEAMRQLNPLINDYGYAAEKARTEQELLNAAQKAGVAVTPELRAQISQTAEQWAMATAEANKLAEAQDKIRQRSEEWQDAQKDALRGIVDDLVAGKSAAEAFAGALQKIANKLLDMAFDDLFTGLFKGGSGGGGLLGGLIPGFAKGTNSAPRGLAVVGENGPELVRFSGGEQVIPNNKLRAPTMPNLRSGVSSSGGSFTFAPVIDARGADSAAVARLEQVVAQQQAQFSGRVVETMINAKKTRNWRGG
ncbi:tape measure protein [Brucella anthropi]|uniref:tape measure protein n=1 Tax=Brucella anthropi TaxID=529 RepID=UPI0009BB652E|nr:tape measure protein [Brucella anthropi]